MPMPVNMVTATSLQQRPSKVLRAKNFSRSLRVPQLPDAIAVAPGIFFVLNDADRHDYLSRRTKRAIDWRELTAKLGFGSPVNSERISGSQSAERHKELLDSFCSNILSSAEFLIKKSS